MKYISNFDVNENVEILHFILPLDSNWYEFSQYTHENGVVDHIKKVHDYGNQDLWNVKRNSLIWF